MATIIAHGEAIGMTKTVRCFIDGMFVRSKNGTELVGKTKIGKGCKVMAVVDKSGIPVAVHVDSANPHEVSLVQVTLDKAPTKSKPKKLIGDKAYDSDKLDQELKMQGIEMISPHKCNRVNPSQDGRGLRSYPDRWLVEDFNNRLQRFRKTVIKYELKANNFIGFVHIATMMVTAQKLGL